MLWAIYCVDKPNMLELRAKLIGAHRQYLDKWDHMIFFSGPQQSDDAKDAVGSLFIISADTRADAKKFIEEETFYGAGVFESVRITRTRSGHFHPELAQ